MVSDIYGRKKALVTSMVVMAASGVVSSFSIVFWFFALLKVFVGAGIGETFMWTLYKWTTLCSLKDITIVLCKRVVCRKCVEIHRMRLVNVKCVLCALLQGAIK